jgi:hypothetical protein
MAIKNSATTAGIVQQLRAHYICGLSKRCPTIVVAGLLLSFSAHSVFADEILLAQAGGI